MNLIDNYIKHRNSEILGGMLTADDEQGLDVMVANLISDLSHSEAEILLLAQSNKNARKYAEREIKDGNSAYAELEQKKNPG